MMDLLRESLSSVNLPYSILFGLMIVYWMLYIVGAVSSDMLDFDLDLDVDTHADLDIDVDGDLTVDGSFMNGLLHFFYVGEFPVFIILSVLITSCWSTSVLVTHYLSLEHFFWFLALVIPNIILGLFVTKTLLMPFAPLLKKAFDQSGDKVEIIGRACEIISPEASPKGGRAEMRTKGAPVILNVKTTDDLILKKGDEALTFDYDKGTETYLITKLECDTEESG